MAYGKTHWETNCFEINVDVENKSDEFAFDLHKCNEVLHAGCRIAVELYKPLSMLSRAATIEEIKRQTLYSPVAVYVDGVRANKSADDMHWTLATEQFFFKERPDSDKGVAVYNLGIFFHIYPHSLLGVSGDLVSRRGHGFTLNMARNDVVQATCPVWRAATKVLSEHSARRHRKERLCDEDRIAIVRKLLAGEDTASDYLKTPLLKTITGRHMSPASALAYADGRVAVAWERGDRGSETGHRERAAVVLAPDMLEWFRASEGHEVVEKMNELWGQAAAAPFVPVDVDAISEQFAGEFEIIPDDRLTRNDTAALEGLQSLSDSLSKALRDTAKEDKPGQYRTRRVRIGVSPNAVAWTDAATTIVFDRSYVRDRTKGRYNGFYVMLTVMLHEYLHTTDDEKSHEHDREFYEHFEAVLKASALKPFVIVREAYNTFRMGRHRRGLLDSKAMARAVDAVEAAAA